MKRLTIRPCNDLRYVGKKKKKNKKKNNNKNNNKTTIKQQQLKALPPNSEDEPNLAIDSDREIQAKKSITIMRSKILYKSIGAQVVDL